MRYLRKINPDVFEELRLRALERQGLTVVRNAAYSGDGGTDGPVIIDDECWLVQAKRYSRAITPTHMRDFDQLLEQRTCCGFFIHTVRTGHMSRAVCSTAPRILTISGWPLLHLLVVPHDGLSGV